MKTAAWLADCDLLLRRSEPRLKQFAEQGHTIKLDVQENGRCTTLEQRVGAELSASPQNCGSTPRDIATLLVATKAQDTATALESVKHRLRPSSVLVLMQNGLLGVHSDILTRVFPAGLGCPHIVLSSLTHGVFRKTDYHFVHAGIGTCSFGHVSSTPQMHRAGSDAQGQPLGGMAEGYSATAAASDISGVSKLFDVLRSIPELHAQVAVSERVLFQQQYLKLAVNCCINPVTAMLGCRNGAIVDSEHARALVRQLAMECFSVLGAQLGSAMSSEGLIGQVLQVATDTAANKSSMLQDVQQSRPTEIDYLNGYLVRLAHQQGTAVTANEAMLNLVKAKHKILCK